MVGKREKFLSKEQKDKIKLKVKENKVTSLHETFSRVSSYFNMSQNTFKKNVKEDKELWEDLTEMYSQNSMIIGSKSSKYMMDVMDKVGKIPKENSLFDNDTNYDGLKIAVDIAKTLSSKSDKVVDKQEKLRRISEERDVLKAENEELKKTVKKISNGDAMGGMPQNIMLVPIIGDYTNWYEGFKMQQEKLLEEMMDMMERDLKDMG